LALLHVLRFLTESGHQKLDLFVEGAENNEMCSCIRSKKSCYSFLS